MAVVIASDDAPMALVRVNNASACADDAHVCDDARAMSLRIAHITESLNITHARACGGDGGVGARSLALVFDDGAIAVEDAPMSCVYVNDSRARVGDAHVRDDARVT